MQLLVLSLVIVGSILLSTILRKKNQKKVQFFLVGSGLAFVAIGSLVLYFMGGDIYAALMLNGIRGFGRSIVFGYVFLLTACILLFVNLMRK